MSNFFFVEIVEPVPLSVSTTFSWLGFRNDLTFIARLRLWRCLEEWRLRSPDRNKTCLSYYFNQYDNNYIDQTLNTQKMSKELSFVVPFGDVWSSWESLSLFLSESELLLSDTFSTLFRNSRMEELSDIFATEPTRWCCYALQTAELKTQ